MTGMARSGGDLADRPAARAAAGPRVSAYTVDAPAGWEHDSITIVSTGQRVGARFIPDADVWAIRKGPRVLNRQGEWVHEPLPSSRTDAFFAACRFSLDEALVAAPAAMDRDNALRAEWLAQQEAEQA